MVKYLERARDPRDRRVRLPTPGGNRKVTAACTAGGAYIAQLAGQRDTEMTNAALRHLKSQSPGIITGGGSYYYYTHYYAIQAMVQAGDDDYAKWYPLIRDALISRQQDGGAWDKGRGQGGSSYTTPMAIIILRPRIATFRFISDDDTTFRRRSDCDSPASPGFCCLAR